MYLCLNGIPFTHGASEQYQYFLTMIVFDVLTVKEIGALFSLCDFFFLNLFALLTYLSSSSCFFVNLSALHLPTIQSFLPGEFWLTTSDTHTRTSQGSFL